MPAAGAIPPNMPKRAFSLIAARDLNDGIGHEGNTISWDAPEDAQFFDDFSQKCLRDKLNCVIMGRKTFESIPGGPPLKNRFNIVLTRNKDYKADFDNVKVLVGDLSDALRFLADDADLREKIDKVYCGGGGDIYRQCFDKENLPFLQSVWITRIHVTEPPATAFFKFDPTGFELETTREQISEKSGVKITFERWNQKNELHSLQ